MNCGAGNNSFEGWDNGHGATLKYLKLNNLADTPSANLLQHLDEATHFIHEQLSKGGGGVVLVHCMGGFSRSPAVIAAYLIRYQRLSVDEALAVLRAKRSCVRPNEGFMKQLQKWWDSQQGGDATTKKKARAKNKHK